MTELRHVLQHLYDPAELRKSSLLDALAGARARPQGRAGYNPLSALRRTLTETIQSLRPGSDVPPHANAWRVYHVLTWRYVEGSSQRDVADSLSISPRQLRRLEWDAARVLADVLWTRYDLEGWDREALVRRADEGDGPVQANGATPGREQELEWAKSSLPSETVDVARLVAAAIQTARPLAGAGGTQVAYEPCPRPCLVTGQVATMRQALLNLITAAVHSAPGGEVRIDLRSDERGVYVRVRAESDAGESSGAEVAEHLQMVRQLAPLCGGRLDVASLQGPGTAALPFAATLILPASKQTTVLVIDDNADTLRLLERYLSGTPYAFVGTRDPEEALVLAERLMPQIILLDIMLPSIDGWELLGRLREHPQVGGVSVLVCSILPQAKLAVTLGAAGYLRKPVSRQALLEALAQHT